MPGLHYVRVTAFQVIDGPTELQVMLLDEVLDNVMRWSSARNSPNYSVVIAGSSVVLLLACTKHGTRIARNIVIVNVRETKEVSYEKYVH